MPNVTIYKVTVPSYYAYPSWNVILKVCYTKSDAEKYIDEYPNVFMKPWLTISMETVNIEDTD
jgi:hypothetical protein